MLPISLCAVAQKSSKPNIIVILADDAGYADFGCYGGKIPTPHINSLSQEGVKFTNGYVTASVCAPSRAGLLTGRYQQRFGFEHNTSNKPSKGFTIDDIGLNVGEQTIGDILKKGGYRTMAIGKWHQGSIDRYFPLNRGFDEFYGFKEGHRDYFKMQASRAEPYAIYNGRKMIPEDSVTYLTDMFSDKAVDFIGENKNRPFFLYLAYNGVHTPMQAKQDDLNQFTDEPVMGRRTYEAMMYCMDKGIGRVLEAVKRHNLDENTLIFFLNDNGGATTNFSDNGVLRGMKGSKWEGGIRVAYIMRWKGVIPQNKTYNYPVSSLDIASTAAALAQVKADALDGINLMPYVTGVKNIVPQRDLFWRRGAAAAVRSGKWKLIRSKSNPVLLFNLDTDISEQYNLAKKNPKIVKRLLDKLRCWERDLLEPRWHSNYGDENQIKKHRMNVVGRERERLYP